MGFRLFDVQLSATERTVLSNSNAALERLRAARQERLVASAFPGLASWALESFIQYGLYRIVALGTGMTAEWNKKRFLNCIVLSRSLIETVGAWFRVLDDTDALLPTEDIRKIHSVLMVAMFGHRNLAPDDKSLPRAINALTGIDRLDRAHPGTRTIYDGICEYVHPNCDGYMLFGQPDDTGNTEFGEQLANKTATISAHYLVVADSFLRSYKARFKNQVEALDKKFGRDVDAWPGDVSDTWRGKAL